MALLILLHVKSIENVGLGNKIMYCFEVRFNRKGLHELITNKIQNLSSLALMTPSSPGMSIAAFISSLHPSNFETSIGFLVEL